MSIAEALASVRTRIADAAARAGRSADEVVLVAVSKTFPHEDVLEAIAAGATDLGENRAQDLRERAAAIGPRARLHFVGHLQRNKVRHVVGIAALIHSVDRVEVADAIAGRAARAEVTQDVLVEVNVSGEASKHGIDPARAVALAREVAARDRIRVRGLMTMPPYPREPEDSRPFYKELARLRDELVEQLPDARALSMGMTRDFEVAIEEGATIVRVGEAIFGSRPAPRASA
jgi:pyridoxal phosphate enzyme (YggS family)